MLVWLDLEMTGLDPDDDVVVEIASLVTDDSLQIVAEGPDLVIGAPPAKLAGMNEVVRKMHERSGLLAAIATCEVTVEEAEARTLEFVREHIVKPQSAPLCGNSIGMDRRFLARHMPALENYLHYRSIDVSSVKELCRRWNPAVYAGAPRKLGGHRALGDIRESVAELAYYRDFFFLMPDTPAAAAAKAEAALAEPPGPADPAETEAPATDPAPGPA